MRVVLFSYLKIKENGVKKCKFCDRSETYDYVQPLGHDWQVRIEEATDEDSGLITTKCKRCKQKTSEKIARIKTVTLANTKYTYNGKEIKPAVKVTDAAGKTIPENMYTVKYINNINAGTAKVKAVFKEKYDAELIKNLQLKRYHKKFRQRLLRKVIRKQL